MDTDYSIELFDMRGDLPLHVGKSIVFERPVKAKATFEQFKLLYQVEPEACEFVVSLNFEGAFAGLFAISENGFIAIVGEAPLSHSDYRVARDKRPAPSIAEQRQMRALYRRLKRLLPDHSFGDMEAVEELVIGASAVNSNFSRCSNCNLPMYVESAEDHRCVRCQKENLCSFCLTSHDCKG